MEIHCTINIVPPMVTVENIRYLKEENYRAIRLAIVTIPCNDG